MERKFLQAAVAVAGIVPVGAGAMGAVIGPNFYGLSGDAAAISHGTYLSALLLGIGLAFWLAIPKIEMQGARISLLTGIVVLGGVARAYALMVHGGALSLEIAFPLFMELVITPAVWFWQRRVASLI